MTAPTQHGAASRRKGFSLRGLFLGLLRRLLYVWVRTRVTPESIETLGLDPALPVCYVLEDRHLADLLVLEAETGRVGLPPALDPMGPALPAEKAAVFSVIVTRNPLSPRTAAPSKRLERLVAAVRRDPALDVQLVPVTVLWGRAPGSQDSLFKALFADAWAGVGPVRQLGIILVHGRQTLVSFALPVSLRRVVSDAHSEDLALRKANRFFRAHFRRARGAAIGPDLSHRRVLVEAMLTSTEMQRPIAEEATRRGISIEAATDRARRFALEIASDFSYPVVRAFELFLRKLWTQLYDEVLVLNGEPLARAARGKGVVYLPCHRSHVDYLLLSYFINAEGLAPPHIAAGANLNFPVVGPLLRKGGAFYLRRTFKGEPLYAAVFREYLHTMISKGFPIAYFIEGGRSRSGRTLAPRGGLLGMTVESYLREHHRPLLLVPIYFGYEKLLEGRTFVAELEGKPKERESIGTLIGVARRLKREYGRVYMNFGTPLPLGPYLDQRAAGWREAAGEERTALARRLTGELAREMVERINLAVVVNPVNLFAMAILSSPRNALDERTLVQQMDMLATIARRLPYSDDAVVTAMDGTAVVAEVLRLGVALRIEHPLGDVIKVPDDQVSTLHYLRNNVLHAYALPALVASLLSGAREVDVGEVDEFIASMQPFLRAELMLHHSADEAVAEGRGILALLVELGLAREVSEGGFRAAETYSAERGRLELLARSLRLLLRRHYLTVALLTRFGPGRLTRARLEEIVQMLSQRLSMLFEFAPPDFYERSAFASYIDTLLETGVVREDGEGTLDFDRRVRASAKSVERLLPPDAVQAIRRVTVEGR
jgi:glycerol-3-phosphate O-acyltransferase